jgi:hypothetical protein
MGAIMSGALHTRFAQPAEIARKLLALSDDGSACDIDPHLTRHWFQLLAETALPEGARVDLCEVGPSSYLPLMTLPEQRGRLLALSNFYTPLFGLIDEARADSLQLKALARALKSARPGWHEVRLAPMDPESLSFARLREAFVAGGWWVDDDFCFGNWYHPVASKSYADYLAGRPSQVRNTLKRASRKLETTAGYELTILDGTQSLEAGIADFVAVYNRSWKNPEPFPEFIPGLCRLATQAGWLRLGLIRIAGQPIAAQLWLVAAGKAHIVKLAYDKAFAKTSAGTVLTAALMKRVIDDDQVDEIDYLTGDDAYKQDWMSCRRERRGLVGFNPGTVRGVLRMLRYAVGKLKRQIFHPDRPI